MNSIRPAGLFAALACLAFGFALCAQPSGSDAQEASTTYATSMPSGAPTDAAPESETPIPMTTQHVLNPIHFVSPTPWKFDDRPVGTARPRAKPTPAPKRTTTPRYATSTRPKTKAHATAAIHRASHGETRGRIHRSTDAERDAAIDGYVQTDSHTDVRTIADRHAHRNAVSVSISDSVSVAAPANAAAG